MTNLPRVPSELIRLALADLAKCEEAADKYRIDMDAWHRPEPSGQCSVCLAGAVMSQTFEAADDLPAGPGDFEDEDCLYALDDFRQGDVDDGLRELGVFLEPTPGRWSHIHVTPYNVSPEAFHIDMYDMADELERAGY